MFHTLVLQLSYFLIKVPTPIVKMITSKRTRAEQRRASRLNVLSCCPSLFSCDKKHQRSVSLNESRCALQTAT